MSELYDMTKTQELHTKDTHIGYINNLIKSTNIKCYYLPGTGTVLNEKERSKYYLFLLEIKERLEQERKNLIKEVIEELQKDLI